MATVCKTCGTSHIFVCKTYDGSCCECEIKRLNATTPGLPDDSEPITREWLATIGFCPVPSDMGAAQEDDMQLGRLNIWELNNTGQWLFEEYDSVSMTTRGHLRLLVRWIGAETRDAAEAARREDPFVAAARCQARHREAKAAEAAKGDK